MLNNGTLVTLTGDATNDFAHALSASESAAQTKFISLHVTTKNLQSIRAESRLHDFCTELVACDHDLIFICETWRSAVEECFVLPSGGQIFLSGRLSHQGVGIAVSGKMMALLSHISFHPYSPILCLLKFTYRGLNFHSFSCYFLTSWEYDASVDGMYELLTVVFVIREGRPIMITGDFTSCLGGVQPGDSVGSLGCCGFGARNARGVHLANWVLQNGLQILSRQSNRTTNIPAKVGRVKDCFMRPACNWSISLQMREQPCRRYGMTTCCPLDWTIDVYTAC